MQEAEDVFRAPFEPDRKDGYILSTQHPLPCDEAVGFRADTHTYYYSLSSSDKTLKMYFESKGVTTFLKRYSNSTFDLMRDKMASQTVDSINNRTYSYITKELFVTPTVAKKSRLSPAELKDHEEKKTKYEKYFPQGTFQTLRAAYSHDFDDPANYSRFVSMFFEQLKNPMNEYVLRDPAKRAQWSALEPKTPEAFVGVFDSLNQLALPLVMTKEDLMGAEDASGAWSRAGSHVHREIELYLNNRPADRPEVRTQNHFQEFLKFHAKTQTKGWEIFRTELSIFSSALNMCGQIDALYSKGRALAIVDWKTSSSAMSADAFADSEFENKRKSDPMPMMKAPLQAFPQTKRFEYFLQMNLYKQMLLEEKAGNLGVTDLDVENAKMHLVFMYDRGDFYQCEVPDLCRVEKVRAWLDKGREDFAEEMVRGFREILKQRKEEQNMANVVAELTSLSGIF